MRRFLTSVLIYSLCFFMTGCLRGEVTDGESDTSSTLPSIHFGSITGLMEYAYLDATAPAAATNAEISPTGAGTISTGAGSTWAGSGSGGSGTGATSTTAASSSGYTNILLDAAVSAPLTTSLAINTCVNSTLAALYASGIVSFQTVKLKDFGAKPNLLVNGARSVTVPASLYTVSQLSDISTGASDAISGFSIYDNKMYFSANYPGSSWVKLHRITSGGVIQRLTHFRTNASDGVTGSSVVYRGELYFFANNASGYSKLFKLDSSDVITQVSNINNNANDSISHLIVYNDALYFGGGGNLQKLNSSGVITRITNFSGPLSLPIIFSGELYFTGLGTGGYKLFKVSSSDVVTQMTNTNPGASDLPENYFIVGSKLYFTAANASGYTKFYSLDSSGNLSLATNINGAAADRDSVLGVYNNALYFVMNTGGFRKIFKIKNDGSVSQVSDMNSGADDVLSSSYPAIEYQGEFYFTGLNSSGRSKLFKMNSSEKIMQLTNILGDSNDEFPYVLGVFDGSLYFRAYASGINRKLYKLTKTY